MHMSACSALELACVDSIRLCLADVPPFYTSPICAARSLSRPPREWPDRGPWTIGYCQLLHHPPTCIPTLLLQPFILPPLPPQPISPLHSTPPNKTPETPPRPSPNHHSPQSFHAPPGSYYTQSPSPPASVVPESPLPYPCLYPSTSAPESPRREVAGI